MSKIRRTRFRHRNAVTAVGLTAALLTMAACSSSGTGGSSGGGASAWTLTGGDEATFRASFDAWNKAHPDEEIKPTFFSNDAYKQKIRTSMGAGKPPALIFGWGGGILKGYVDAGQVADLSADVAAVPELKSRFLPSIAATGQIDGKTYALPATGMQPVVLFYNKDVFKKVGLQPPATFDELMADIPKFQTVGAAAFSVGGQSKWPYLMWEEYLVDRIGGPQVFDNIAAGKPGAWSDPAVLKANTVIQQLVDAGAFVKGFSSIAADSGSDLALLYTGKAAMLLQGSWNYPELKAANPKFLADGKLGWVAFPTVAGGTGDPRDVAGNPAQFWSISSKASASEKKAAFDYVSQGVMSSDYVSDLLKGGSVPPVAGLESQLASAQDADWLSYIYDLAKDAPHYQLSWDQALSPTQADALLTNLDKVFLKQINPGQFATYMNETVGK